MAFFNCISRPFGFAVILTALTAVPVRAADVTDIQSPYQGQWHHLTNSDFEFLDFDLTINSTQPNGKFAGFFGKVPIKGKVKTNGKVTFSGKFTSQALTAKISKGKGQLSATGEFILGTLRFKATGELASQSGSYTFNETTLSKPGVQRGSSVHASANINNLASSYTGFFHHNTEPTREDSPAEFTVTAHNPNGTFTGTSHGVPITGKVSSKGKVTFSGATGTGANTLKAKGTLQLSATGATLLGTVTLVGKGTFAVNSGKGTVEFYSAP